MQPSPISMPTHPSLSPEELELHQTAFHEAGHAVLAALAGTYELGGIDVSNDQGFGQFDCELSGPRHQLRDTRFGRNVCPLSELAVILGGGAAAQLSFLHANRIGLDDKDKLTSETERYLELCAHGDRSMAKELIPLANFTRAIGDAHRIFQESAVWAAVDRLANAVILRGGLMNARQVRELLDREVTQGIGIRQLV